MDTLEQKYVLECAIMAAMLQEFGWSFNDANKLFRDCIVAKFPDKVA